MSTLSEQLFMEAQKSYIHHQISCAIVYRSRVIAIGYNSATVHSSLRHQCLL